MTAALVRLGFRPKAHVHAYRMVGLSHRTEYVASYTPREIPVLVMACDCGEYEWRDIWFDPSSHRRKW